MQGCVLSTSKSLWFPPHRAPGFFGSPEPPRALPAGRGIWQRASGAGDSGRAESEPRTVPSSSICAKQGCASLLDMQSGAELPRPRVTHKQSCLVFFFLKRKKKKTQKNQQQQHEKRKIRRATSASLIEFALGSAVGGGGSTPRPRVQTPGTAPLLPPEPRGRGDGTAATPGQLRAPAGRSTCPLSARPSALFATSPSPEDAGCYLPRRAPQHPKTRAECAPQRGGSPLQSPPTF